MTVSTFVEPPEPAVSGDGGDDNSAPPIQRDFSRWIAATAEPEELTLGVAGFSFPDLFRPERLRDLTDLFEADLREKHPDGWTALSSLRGEGGAKLGPEALSDALLAVAPHVSAFVARLFCVEGELEA